MSIQQTKHLQHELNYFFATFLPRTTTPLIVDGHQGRLTSQYTREAKWLLGHQRPLNSTATGGFVHRLRHPKSIRFADKATVARGIYRRENYRRNHKRDLQAATRLPGVGVFDGRPVARWLIPYMIWAREEGPKHGVPWHGQLVSGYRTPTYSEQLCYNMCGRPQCPGRCAGRATRHAKATPPPRADGAIDVSDYIRFRASMAKCPLTPRIYNALPSDLVHFSPFGN